MLCDTLFFVGSCCVNSPGARLELSPPLFSPLMLGVAGAGSSRSLDLFVSAAWATCRDLCRSGPCVSKELC